MVLMENLEGGRNEADIPLLNSLTLPFLVWLKLKC